MNENNRIAGKELKQSLRLVTIAASFGVPFFTITTGPALTGFIRKLGAGDFVYTVIMALPVLGAILQVFVSYMIEATGKRKTIFIVSGFIHRLLWIPVAIIPYMVAPGNTELRIWLVILLIIISTSANSFASITFNSWMGSLVPTEIKGRFFSRRTMIYTITGGITALVSGKLLDLIPGFPGYCVVFILAAILGATDIVCFFGIKEPEMVVHEERPDFFKLLMEPLKNKNYMRYTIFVSFWYFSVNIAGPFFNVYMIEKLKMDYFLITLFSQFAANVTTILTIQIWGRLADIYGNKLVTRICCSILFILPFLWIFATPHSTWVALVIGLLSGIFWPGFEMTAFNQSIWLSPEKGRSGYIAIYTLVVTLIGTALAFICGGVFMELTGKVIAAMAIPFLPGETLSSFHVLFILSSVFRLAVLLFLFRGYDEENSKNMEAMMSDLSKLIRKRFTD